MSPASAKEGTSAKDTAIRPFRVDISDSAIADLNRRLESTRWPDRETVADQSQGVQLATIQELVRYWRTSYNWRKAEEKLNALPQFVTTIDGVDIQFIHVRSPNPNALPMIMTHGWPGSIFEMIKVIGPLTDPVKHGGRAEDAFDLVVPSLPGFGFSGRPTVTGWNPDRIARAWAELMRRLGYERYVAQGGDWGAVISGVLARQAAPGLIGIHVNFPVTMPKDVWRALECGHRAPPELSPAEKGAFEQLNAFYTRGSGYSAVMGTRPQTLGYALADSPVGLGAWFFDMFVAGTDSGGHPERVLSRDEMLDDISLYWFTNTETSAARLYWETWPTDFSAVDISLPTAVTVFPGDIYRAPRSWAERAYHNLIYFHEVDRGGHFAAWEQPALFSIEIRAAFRSLR